MWKKMFAGFTVLLLADTIGAVPAGRPVISLLLDGENELVCGESAGTTGETACVTRGRTGPLWVPGIHGNALWFSGEPGQGVVVSPRTELNLTDELTIAAWIRPCRFIEPQKIQGHEFQTIVWKGDRSGEIDRINYRLALRPKGTLEFTFKGPMNEWYQIIGDDPVPAGKWSLVAVAFDRGEARLYLNGKCIAKSRMTAFLPQGGDVKVWQGDRMLPNDAPLHIGIGQKPGGEPGYPFRGAIDDVRLWPAALSSVPFSTPPETDPLDSLLAWEKTFTADEIRATPYLVGRIGDRNTPWLLHIEYPGYPNRRADILGKCASDGRFRYLLNEFCGPIELREASRLKVSIYRTSILTGELALTEVALTAGISQTKIAVTPEKQFQKIRGFGCFADWPRTFYSDPSEQDARYGPLLDRLREIGVTHLDVQMLAKHLEPENDDSDPRHINWDCFRRNFQDNPRNQVEVNYLRYLQSGGFTVGLRVHYYTEWQWLEQSKTRGPDIDEVAEYCVALLALMTESGVKPTYLTPLWEPHFSPETVAELCARTARLARRHGIDIPIVGPYRIATGAQSENTDAADHYLLGRQYVGAYLKIAGDVCDVIGVEDYAAGCSLIEPNLKRLWNEVIEPGNPSGRSKELWILEYGPACGPGPWNSYPSRWHGGYATYESAFRLARSLHQQFNSGVSNFLFWKAYDAIGDSRPHSSYGLLKSEMHDFEPRPPYYIARMFWKHIPPGARRLACESDSEVLAGAFQKNGRFTVVISNPRPDEVRADLCISGKELAPQVDLYTSTEQVKYEERVAMASGDTVSDLPLPPRSVCTVVCREAHIDQPFDRTVWPDHSSGVVYLSDLQWIGVSVTNQQELRNRGLKTDGSNVSVQQDETAGHEWLVINRTRYRKGLGATVPSEVVYCLDGRYLSFEAVVGIDDAAARVKGGVPGAVFEVVIDGKRAFSSGPMKLGWKQAVNLSCQNAKELRLIVTCPEDTNMNTPVDWGEARLRIQGM